MLGKLVNIVTNHVIFGEQKIEGVICGLIDDEKRKGVQIGKYNLYCKKENSSFFYEENVNSILIKDSLLTILIEIL